MAIEAESMAARHGGPRWVQDSLLEEEAATIELRVSAERGSPDYLVSTTLVRPDGTWLACTVGASTTGEAETLRQVAEMMKEAWRQLREAVGPF